MKFLFLLFVVMPIVEITLLIKVGEMIGLWPTVGLVLFSAFVGVNMLRYQGFSTLRRAQEKMNTGEMPGQEMAEGIFLAIGGALLVTPGFVTDVIGFSCLLPFTRQWMVRQLAKNATVISSGSHSGFHMHMGSAGFDPRQPGAGAQAGDIIDGEVVDSEVVDPHRIKNK